MGRAEGESETKDRLVFRRKSYRAKFLFLQVQCQGGGNTNRQGATKHQVKGEHWQQLNLCKLSEIKRGRLGTWVRSVMLS